MDCRPPGSSVHEVLQARMLEWVAISSPGNLPNPEIEPWSSALQADILPTEPTGNDQAGVPGTARRFLDPWTTREVPGLVVNGHMRLEASRPHCPRFVWW